jgi:hypothetical protein
MGVESGLSHSGNAGGSGYREESGEKVVAGLRRLHDEELHNLCSSPNIIRAIKSG